MFWEDFPNLADRYFQPGIFPTSEYLLVGTIIVAWLLSIVFMVRIRFKPESKGEGTE